MPYYLVESYDFKVQHGGRSSQGVLGEQKSSEKLYLHVLPLSDLELAALQPRIDEHGNKEHARLALPRNEEFWIAVEGEASWPKLYRPRVTSRCDLASGAAKPVALTAEELERLRKAGLAL